MRQMFIDDDNNEFTVEITSKKVRLEITNHIEHSDHANEYMTVCEFSTPQVLRIFEVLIKLYLKERTINA